MRRSTIAAVAALTLSVAGCAGSAAKSSTPGTSASTTTTQLTAGAMAAQAVASYRTYVEGEAQKLVASTTQFVQAVRSGNVAAAKAMFPETRSHYERIEPIAERFGVLDPDIDARANDVPAAKFEGFHRIEEQLWEKGNTGGMAPVADALLANVSDLQSRIPLLALDPGLLANGAVELLNEVATSKITGEEDRYSHTDLSDFEANLDGAREAIVALRPLIVAKSPALANALDTRFAATKAVLARYRKGSGFVLYTTLTRSDTRALAAQVDALADEIAKVRPLVQAT